GPCREPSQGDQRFGGPVLEQKVDQGPSFCSWNPPRPLEGGRRGKGLPYLDSLGMSRRSCQAAKHVEHASDTEKTNVSRPVASPTRPRRGLQFALANGALFAQLGPAARLAGLLVVLTLAQFLLEPAALQQLLEAAQGRTNRFSVMDTHPQWHT